MRTVAVCDDNEMQLTQAIETLRSYADDAGIDMQIERYDKIEDCIRESPRFDVAFMDIEFEDGPEGIEAVARINDAAPQCRIVYLTNYLHYSLDVYGTDHVWYVLKSQLEQRLPEIFSKLDAIDRERRTVFAISPIGEDALVSVSCKDVRYLERRLRITHLFMRNGTDLEVREKLSDLVKKLPETSFARCHNSYIVNLSFVKRLRSADLDLYDGTSLPVSRNCSKRFREKYLRWLESTSV